MIKIPGVSSPTLPRATAQPAAAAQSAPQSAPCGKGSTKGTAYRANIPGFPEAPPNTNWQQGVFAKTGRSRPGLASSFRQAPAEGAAHAAESPASEPEPAERGWHPPSNGGFMNRVKNFARAFNPVKTNAPAFGYYYMPTTGNMKSQDPTSGFGYNPNASAPAGAHVRWTHNAPKQQPSSSDPESTYQHAQQPASGYPQPTYERTQQSSAGNPESAYQETQQPASGYPHPTYQRTAPPSAGDPGSAYQYTEQPPSPTDSKPARPKPTWQSQATHEANYAQFSKTPQQSQDRFPKVFYENQPQHAQANPGANAGWVPRTQQPPSQRYPKPSYGNQPQPAQASPNANAGWVPRTQQQSAPHNPPSYTKAGHVRPGPRTTKGANNLPPGYAPPQSAGPMPQRPASSTRPAPKPAPGPSTPPFAQSSSGPAPRPQRHAPPPRTAGPGPAASEAAAKAAAAKRRDHGILNTYAAKYGLTPLEENASPAELKALYRKLSLKMHPDKPGGDLAEFQKMGNAYHNLY